MSTIHDTSPEVYALRRRRVGLVAGPVVGLLVLIVGLVGGCDAYGDPCIGWDGSLSAGGVRKHSADVCA